MRKWVSHYNLGSGNSFSVMTPKAQATKEKTDILDYIKMKNLCTINGFLQIFANHISDKGLVPRIYKTS